jgi:hypothetical protein
VNFANAIATAAIVAVCMRHHRGQFAIAERADDRHDARDAPDHQQQSRALHLMGYIARNDEDGRADHRPHDDHDRVKKAEAFDEIGSFAGDARQCLRLLRHVWF